ncbi:MAG: NAD(P)/FAD-dependent oxidoreductase [Rhodospirillaceae bacterium]|jgi:cation diffusion facilitator CzcD-associated flavoprotein CzcO|nr:NAD(P)/FAD-dependent oxidoreductase [Rhodospirillaceae bacterium]MBT5191010.1 NAD(P)/FAD-dependent oxidoreductase [Rhodospirillaceae bacterium]MBT5894507.1 NAD(P)/FAD-dependent oxidoreductase [Rhodospirillaceae bacterium]MBT7760497.1 NAD(P)/FAD-dependent oxidoreductase [Rhodospirillaceae bacterium]
MAKQEAKTNGTGQRASAANAEHFDVLIVGAGISGIAGAYQLRQECPDTSFTILETEDSFGGTWWTHRSPGIRSDSDLHTFGYSFKPWIGPPIATAEEILNYMGDVIEENDLDQYIRYRHKIVKADWSHEDSLWSIEAVRLDTDETVRITCNFLWMCQGYYRHREGYTPDWQGMDDFKGVIAHPENWPEDLDYAGKNILVIGSGATAATVIPAMAGTAAHVTMLQRSPTYFRPGRNAIDIAETLRELQVDEETIHDITRRKIMFDQSAFTEMCFDNPEAVKKEMLAPVRELLGPDYDVDKHFTPSYMPWRQRIAFVPDGDLFEGIKSGKASVVTDQIDRFTEKGILLQSGEELEADIIVTATGFNMNIMGDIAFTLDGKPLDFHDTVTYRGMMFTGVPNLAWVFGYFRASWTLRSELIADFVCRLLNHMKGTDAKSVEPALPEQDKDMPLFDWMDEDNFNPNYLKRAMPLLPKRGNKLEWQHTQDYWREKNEFPEIDLEDEVFVYRWGARSNVAAE